MENVPVGPAALAAHEERRLARVLREIGGAGAPIGEGWMAADAPGSWSNFAVGVGFHELVPSTLIEQLTQYYWSQNLPAQIQITPFHQPSLSRELHERGFREYDAETLLIHDLENILSIDAPDGVSFSLITPETPRSIDDFLISQVASFATTSSEAATLKPILRRVLKSDSIEAWLLKLGDKIIGSGMLETSECSAVLCGATVHPQWRRLGVHSAFTRYRMQRAAERRLDWISVASLPGGPTQLNAIRLGFQPSYKLQRLRLYPPNK